VGLVSTRTSKEKIFPVSDHGIRLKVQLWFRTEKLENKNLEEIATLQRFPLVESMNSTQKIKEIEKTLKETADLTSRCNMILRLIRSIRDNR